MVKLFKEIELTEFEIYKLIKDLTRLKNDIQRKYIISKSHYDEMVRKPHTLKDFAIHKNKYGDHRILKFEIDSCEHRIKYFKDKLTHEKARKTE
ncbi:MAG: hypothetical protein ACRDD7_07225 [Peptostreptococcaceae bacterium]